VYHGVATPVKVGSQESGVRSQLFHGLPGTIEAGRYHSWIVSDEDFPKELEVTARDDNNYIMGLQHKKYDVQGVQFHPESVLTPMGEVILSNWLKS
jgi:anthranilate synthase component 2